MAPTIELIESITLSSSAANVTFSNIPQGYDDLLLVCSARSTRGPSNLEDGLGVRLNSITTGYTYRLLSSVNTTVSSQNTPFEQPWTGRIPANGATANTFSNTEVYIPNYAGSTAKSYSATSVSEHNGNDGYITVNAINNTTTAAINQLFISALNGNLVSNSTFELYGIKDADDGAEGYFGPAARGGDEVYTTGDGYKVHVFKTSGTLEVTSPGEVEYLVVAGGGGGAGGGDAYVAGGGGGAGGYRSSVSWESSGGGSPVESPLKLSAQTYSITVGAGGPAGAAFLRGSNGSNSSIATVSTTGGGGGGGYSTSSNSPQIGGSGGGAGSVAVLNGASSTGASGTTNEGYSGGNGMTYAGANSNTNAGGGGGGAGSAGVSRSGTTGGAGGAGIYSFITGSSIGRAGGGGAGGAGAAGTATDGGGVGGIGSNGTSGSTNTGGGGGGGHSNFTTNYTGGNGGSGIVIIRYKI